MSGQLEFPQDGIRAKPLFGARMIQRVVQPTRFLPAGGAFDDQPRDGDEITEF